MFLLYNQAMYTPSVCQECDTLQQVSDLPAGTTANCMCCGSKLYSHPKGGLDVPLALMLACSILYLVANLFPLITLDIQGISQATTLSGAAVSLYREDMKLLAVIVWLTSVAGPGIIIFSALYILTALRLALSLPGLKFLLVLLSRFQPWGMMDVFMLGMLVALVKLGGMAEVIPGPGVMAFTALVFLFAAAMSKLEVAFLWQSLEQAK